MNIYFQFIISFYLHKCGKSNQINHNYLLIKMVEIISAVSFGVCVEIKLFSSLSLYDLFFKSRMNNQTYCDIFTFLI